MKEGVVERKAVDAWEALDRVDAEIDATKFGRLSLDPNKNEATHLVDLVQGIVGKEDGAPLAKFVAQVAEAQLRNFPDNLFWDFDYYAKSIWDDACANIDGVAYLEKCSQTATTLMDLYGQHSAIRFRYVHDFLYGFDWARWVKRAPDRATHGPFGRLFLEYSGQRAHELLALIDNDDRKYPKLESASSRNPFPFMREPNDEKSLYRRLASAGWLPVNTWDADTTPDWGRDYEKERKRFAESLGLARSS